MITLADIQADPQFQEATGYCPTSDNFLGLLNMAVQELLIRGDWPGTVVPIQVCIKNGCVTWPNYVAQIRALNSCLSSIPVKNVWYQFLEHGHAGGPEAWYGAWAGRGGCIQPTALMQFRAPTYNDPYGTDCYLRIFPAAAEDVGTEVQVFGLDGNGQPLMTHNSDGTWTEGITITVGNPYGSSSTVVTKIDRVVKPVTQNALRLYAYDSVNNWPYDLAVWAPWETNPSYLRYQIDAGCAWNFQTCSTCNKSIVALVKLKQVPIKLPTDLVLIDNMRSLLNTLRALKSEAANNIPQAQGQLQVAVEGLNRSLENDAPDYQMSVKNNIYGGRIMTNRAF